MPKELFIVCVVVICVLAAVLIAWLIVSLIRMNRNKGVKGKVVVVDETAYELVPIGEAPTGVQYAPAPAPAAQEPAAPVQAETAVAEAVPQDTEGMVMLRRNENVPYPEAYARLSSKQRGYVDEILRYAETKADVKKIVNDKSASVYLGKKLVVRIVIKRGVISARLSGQNNEFNAHTDKAGLKIKEKPIDIKVEAPEMVSAVKDIIDLSFRDLVLERARREEEKKAARREKRRLAREAKLAAEAEAKAAAEADQPEAPAAEAAEADQPEAPVAEAAEADQPEMPAAEEAAAEAAPETEEIDAEIAAEVEADAETDDELEARIDAEAPAEEAEEAAAEEAAADSADGEAAEEEAPAAEDEQE